MTETIVETESCPTCSTELPANAAFCYHCGNSIKPEMLSADDNEKVSDVWLRGDITKKLENDPASEELLTDSTPENYPVSTVENLIKDEKPEENIDVQKESENTELQSAASLRVKAKKLPPREIKVRWEEYENAPNLLFLGGSILLVALSLVIYFLAMYLR